MWTRGHLGGKFNSSLQWAFFKKKSNIISPKSGRVFPSSNLGGVCKSFGGKTAKSGSIVADTVESSEPPRKASKITFSIAEEPQGHDAHSGQASGAVVPNGAVPSESQVARVSRILGVGEEKESDFSKAVQSRLASYFD